MRVLSLKAAKFLLSIERRDLVEKNDISEDVDEITKLTEPFKEEIGVLYRKRPTSRKNTR